MTRRWEVTLDSGERLDLGILGKSPMRWAGTAEGETVEEAVTQAREICRKSMGDRYADGHLVETHEIFDWAITLRGKRDKRRRETFIVRATDERSAIRHLNYMPAVYPFAGALKFRRGETPEQVVKVVRR
jgi:hypothetical protein